MSTSETHEEKTYLEKAEAKQDNIDKKLDQFATYQKMRAEAHGKNIPAPIVKDKDGNIHWLNRKQRRAQQRRMKHAKSSVPQKTKRQETTQSSEKAQETKEITQEQNT